MELLTYRKFYQSPFYPTPFCVLSIIILLFAITLSSCVNDVNEVNQTTQLAEPNVEHGKNIELFYSEYGKVKVRVTAPEVTRYYTDDPYSEFTKGLHVEFYNDSMKITSTLTANYGIRYENQLKTIMRNDVQVVNENNENLNTDELIWDEKKHIIYSDKFVKITTPDQILYGQGMEADEQLTKYKIKLLNKGIE